MAASSTSESGTAPPPVVQEVSKGIYAYLQPDWSWFLNNTGFIVGEHGVTVVDACATERRTRAFIEHIRRLTDRPLRTLVNTHHHGDHTFGNFAFTPAAIVGHERCREEVERVQLTTTGLVSGVDWGALQVAPPFITFEDRVNVYVDGLKLELIFVGPAHTIDDIVIWMPERRVLFAGDLLFNKCTPFVVEGSVANYFSALETARRLDPEIIVPGHGEVCGPEVIDEVERYLRFVQRTGRRAFAAGLSPLEAAKQADLGAFAGWGESERLVGNLARAYSELRGEPLGHPLPLGDLVPQMAAYAGGPLRSLA